MKLVLSLVFFISLSNASQTQPSMKELQKMVGEFKEAYGIIDDDKSKSKYDINKKYSDKEIKEQVDKMEKLLKTDPTLKKVYGK
ncbi:MAG: hypothetical protein U9Q20_01485 [Campylobacterota bacterium]|nr:hypothetical protein [Campylobacterota bacterium]